MCLHTVEMVLQQASSNFAALSAPTTKQNKTKTTMLMGCGIIFIVYQLLECNEVSLFRL